MAIVVAVTNMKGGVGKTTLTANIGHCLSFVYGKKVLLVDVDPQFNLTQYCMKEAAYDKILKDKNQGTVFDILVPDSMSVPKVIGSKSVQKEQVFSHVLRDKLDLVPSSMKLIDFIDQRKSGSERLLSKYIEKQKDKYNFIFIDCPPTSTILSRAAYLSSDAYIIPMGMDYFSVMGIPLLQKDINEFSETYGVDIKGIGIIRTRYLDWTTVAKKHKEIVEKFSNALKIPLFKSSFTQRQDVQNALSNRQFILEYQNNSTAANDIKAITKEFLERVEKWQEGKK
ncbi:MAG: ParA family protein [Smithellaceae bacterium]|jgi:chromosome partitioning protein